MRRFARSSSSCEGLRARKRFQFAIAAEPVELPEHERVAGLDRLETGSKARAVVAAAELSRRARCGTILEMRYRLIPLALLFLLGPSPRPAFPTDEP